MGGALTMMPSRGVCPPMARWQPHRPLLALAAALMLAPAALAIPRLDLGPYPKPEPGQRRWVIQLPGVLPPTPAGSPSSDPRSWRVQLVVGEPKHADGGAHDIARLARRFAQRLNGRFNLPVALADETLSSATAAQRRNEAGLRGAELDAAAAAEILMTWLELQRKKTGETS